MAAFTGRITRSLTEKPPQRLWIIASGEMGGPENDITEVMGQVTAEEPTVDCPSLPKSLQPVRLSSGIWLGAPSILAATQPTEGTRDKRGMARVLLPRQGAG